MLLQDLCHIEEHEIRILRVRTAVIGEREGVVAIARDIDFRTIEEGPAGVRETQHTRKALHLSATRLFLEVIGQIFVGIALIVVLTRTQPEIGQVARAVAEFVGNHLQLIGSRSESDILIGRDAERRQLREGEHTIVADLVGALCDIACDIGNLEGLGLRVQLKLGIGDIRITVEARTGNLLTSQREPSERTVLIELIRSGVLIERLQVIEPALG